MHNTAKVILSPRQLYREYVFPAWNLPSLMHIWVALQIIWYMERVVLKGLSIQVYIEAGAAR